MKVFYLLLAAVLTALALLAGRPPQEPFSLSAGADGASAGARSIEDALARSDAGYERALAPKTFVFPDDHGPHDRFKTEWWYFTGNLANAEGRRFGYELTFFRFALKPEPVPSASAWRSNQLYMAHLAVTDPQRQRFYARERFSRAGNGLAGADAGRLRVWLNDWSAEAIEDARGAALRLRAKTPEMALDLALSPEKSPVPQGDRGLSQKSPEAGNASYYYSYPRVSTEGTLVLSGRTFTVRGQSWMDREWGTSALSPEQAGWDWFALQLSDHTELMFYRLRRKDGQKDPNSAGSYILPDSARISLTADAVAIDSPARWQSPRSGIVYPSGWHLAVPDLKLELDVKPLMADQELNLSYRYWEGAVAVTGTKTGKPVTGQGYVELTGYK